MFGDRLIKSNNAGAACTTDTVQILDGVPLESIATYQLNNATTSIPSNTYPGTPTDITYATGKFGQAAVFNGSSSYIDTTFTVPAISTYSASLWFKTSATGINQCIFSDSNSNGQDNSTRLGVIITNANTFGITLGNGSTSYYNGNVSAISYLNNAWHNLVITYSGTTIKLYINNSLIVTYTSTVSAGTLGTQTLKIGRLGDYSGFYFNGSIDQVRIFNTALSAGAVTSLYNETVATASNSYINVPSCVAYYKMSDATDETGSYDGTATNVNFNVAGKFGNAASFNGSNSNITSLAGFSGNPVFSFSFWVKPNATSVTPISFGSASSGIAFITFINPSNKLNFGRWGDDLGSTTASIPNGVWTHVAVSNNAGNVQVYINGNADLSFSTTYNIISNNFYIGSAINSVQYFNGKIDQVRIFDKAITATEVETLYNEVQCIPTIVPTDYFNTVLYTGNGGTQSISSLDFTPDFVWAKSRDTGTQWHGLYDTIRGVGESLYSNATNAEEYRNNSLTAFNSDGFSVGDWASINLSGDRYVSWNWKAGGTAVSNTDGTITSQVSANVDAGFSVVKWNSSSNLYGSVGHGLSATPELIIMKRYSTTGDWLVWTPNLGDGTFLRLNTTGALATWGNGTLTPITSTTFTNADGGSEDYIAYAFHSVEGYSRIGSYVGTGASGNAIVTGFRPAYVMIKSIDKAVNNWDIFDNKRDTTNPNTALLQANTSGAEVYPPLGINFLSNGFEPESNYFNDSGNTFIFMAFAEEVFVPDNFFNDDSTLATYKLNGDAGDDSGNGYNGIASNVTYAAGKFDDAAVFNGSSSYVSASNPLSGFSASGNYSVSVWVNVNSTPATSGGTIFGSYVAPSAYPPHIWITTSTLRAHGYQILDFSNNLSTGTWYNIVLVNSGTNTSMYINGNLQTPASTTTWGPPTAGNFVMGGLPHYFDGQIDQVRIFDRALNAGEVTQLYNE